MTYVANETLLAIKTHIRGLLRSTLEIVSFSQDGLKIRRRRRKSSTFSGTGHYHTITLEDATLTVKCFTDDNKQYHTFRTDITDPRSIDDLETLLTKLYCVKTKTLRRARRLQYADK